MLAAAAAATALSLVLAPGPVQAAPAPSYALPSDAQPPHAKTSSDPLAGLQVHPEWGTITGQDGVLRRSCHKYSYSYSIQPPEGIWAIEIFISGPGLKHLAAGAFLDGYDPTTGAGIYKLCRVTTRYGKFTIEAKVSADDGSGHLTEGQLPPDTFRLRRPHR
jgi:hypothetical protein